MTAFRTASLAFGLAVLALAILVCFVRVVRGPTVPDRVIAVDLSTTAAAGLMAVAGIAFDDDVFLDVSLILIVTSFFATAGFALLIEREGRP